MDDTLIRVLFGLLIVFFFIVRAYHHRKAEREGGKIEYREKNLPLIKAMRLVGGFLLLGALGAYFVAPAWLAWSSIPFPAWLRWFGLALGYASLALIWWTEASLGKNFNTTLHVREGHNLITHGPYRYVRHPMYTGLFLFVVSWLLASANLVIGLPGLLSLTVIVLNRLQLEEATMIDLFGDKYRDYVQRTGRFLPRLTRH
jgi:protein-S-isoprenylcysteine O-methyltransferase Ste14